MGVSSTNNFFRNIGSGGGFLGKIYDNTPWADKMPFHNITEKGVEFTQATMDPAGAAINAVHKLFPAWDDFVNAPIDNTMNVIKGKEKFGQHANWGGGRTSVVTNTMRGLTEGQYFKEWDKYSTTSQREAAITAEKYNPPTPKERERLVRTTKTAAPTSLLTDEEKETRGLL